MYHEGQGVEVDYNIALEWYLKAAEQGYAMAQNSVGVMYHLGEGVVEEDVQKAVLWYSKAAAQGNMVAQQNLEKASLGLRATHITFVDEDG